MLMNVCYFILDGMLLTTEAGAYRMATFSDEHMAKLFEKFVLEYYKRHHSELNANAEYVEWNIDRENSPMVEFLPKMKTDIMLKKGSKTLIIDTKYYGHMMQEQFNKLSINSSNLYQIFTYVKNQDSEGTGNVSGMLLYAKTDEAVAPDLDAVFGKNRIRVKTLDLNCEFSKIAEQLDGFVESAEFK